LKISKKQLSKVHPLLFGLNYITLDNESYDIKDYPFLEEIFNKFVYEETEKEVVIQKAAQMGFSVLAIILSLFVVNNKKSVLYLLATRTDSYDFSASKVNPLIESSDYLTKLFSNATSVQHKRAKNANFYLRGSNSATQLKSISADMLVLDEWDEINKNNSDLAFDRLDASNLKWVLKLSTPTVPDVGIDKSYKETDQRKWFVKCKKCNSEQTPTWPDNVDFENKKYICSECGSEINFNTSKGYWKTTNPKSEKIGYYINQMVSPTKTAEQLINTFKKAKGNQTKLANFYNSKLGLPYMQKGDRISTQQVLSLIDKDLIYTQKERQMGVDVGTYIDYEITELQGNIKKVIKAGRAKKFKELEDLIKQYNVKVAVIDKDPERREAVKLTENVRKKCLVFLCNYQDDMKKEEMKFDKKRNWVSVDRTATMDTSLARFKQNTIKLSPDIPECYATHIHNTIRVIEEKQRNNVKTQIARYRNTGDDHFAHANNYNEIAVYYYKNLYKNNEIGGILIE